VEGLTNLEELYLSHNGAKAADGVESLTALTTLDLSHNFIASLLPLSALKNLDEVWVRFDQYWLFSSPNTPIRQASTPSNQQTFSSL